MKPINRQDHKHVCFYSSLLTFNSIQMISTAFKPNAQTLPAIIPAGLLKLYTFVTTYLISCKALRKTLNSYQEQNRNKPLSYFEQKTIYTFKHAYKKSGNNVVLNLNF